MLFLGENSHCDGFFYSFIRIEGKQLLRGPFFRAAEGAGVRSIVSTIPDKCKRCYSCIRNCPAQAIKVEKGQAAVISERCISCGTCVTVCAQKAKRIQDDTAEVKRILQDGRRVVACLAPSFPAVFGGLAPGRWVGALKALGFHKVVEVAFGAELVTKRYEDLVRTTDVVPLISTPCPSIVFLIEKSYPALVPNLAPVLSPMLALGRAVRERLDPGAAVVFIGPCIAKKQEIQDEKVQGIVDAVLTFPEVKSLFDEKGVCLKSAEDLPFEGPTPDVGRSFPISGGLLKTASLSLDILGKDIIVTEGKDRVLRILDEVAAKRIDVRFIDVLFCEGCINGPMMGGAEMGFVSRHHAVVDYIRTHAHPRKTRRDTSLFADLDLSRSFTPFELPMAAVTEEAIREVLRSVNKFNPEDELNCGACGYGSCREKAIAVILGIAEREMCLPYLISSLEISHKELSESHSELARSHSQLSRTLKQLESTQRQLIQSAKLASMGQLAASVAHEINNPLAGILNYLVLMKRKVSRLAGAGPSAEQESVGKYLEIIERETVRCSDIVKNLLDFARLSEPVRRPVDINLKLVKSLKVVAHQAALRGITIFRDFAEIPEVLADPPPDSADPHQYHAQCL
jgi:iron only hydrogenase large subunit-like protein